MNINVNELTIGQAKELANLFGNNQAQTNQTNKAHPFEIGKNYFIRTVTMSHVGKLEAVYDDILVLSSASWVADTGRFGNAMKSGLEAIDSSEIEPFVNNIFIGRGALIDMTIYNFPLPTKQK
jgi:hypothetical protein